MHVSTRQVHLPRLLLGALVIAGAAGCATGGTPKTASARPSVPSVSHGSAATSTPSATGVPAASQEPDTGAGKTSGDVPDNAVYLTYKDPKLGYSIQYVEGWQVASAADGVAIRDKDSSETIQVVTGRTGVATFVSGADLPSLRARAGFQLVKQDTVTVSGKDLIHLVYEIPSPPDPVTGKQVPQAVDRYYVPGTNGIAIVTLATPKGVDNLDAFRKMIESFRWA